MSMFQFRDVMTIMEDYLYEVDGGAYGSQFLKKTKLDRVFWKEVCNFGG